MVCMMQDSKALLANSKALPPLHMQIYDQAMLSTSEIIAAKLAIAIETSGVKQSAIAIACGVSKQAVQGWLKTGRIDKKHLITLAKLTGRDLTWWLEGPTSTAAASEEGRAIAQTVISQIHNAAQLNLVSREDWQLLELIVQRFTQASPALTTQLGAPIAPEYLEELEAMSQRAEELHAKGIKRKVAARR